MKSLAIIFTFAFAAAFAISARATDSQSSADYFFNVESIDGGGLRAASAHYMANGSFSAGNFISSADYAQRGGYVGQLNNPPALTNFPVSVVTNSTIKIPVAQLLAAVKDVDGDSVSFVSVVAATAQNGAASRSGNFVLYRPANGFSGADSITWFVQDSEGDRTAEIISAQVGAPPPLPNAPTLNLVSIAFDAAPNSTDATLRFASLPGTTYTVQFTDDLTPPVTWTTIGSAATTNGVFKIVDPTARNATQRYYRTIIQTQ